MGRVEEMSFGELVQALVDLDRQREREGEPLDIERTLERSAIDQRLGRLLSRQTPGEERRTSVRVPGDLGLSVTMGERRMQGTIIDLGEGGLQVAMAEELPELAAVEVELGGAPAEGELPPRAAAKVAWVRGSGQAWNVGLQFVGQSSVHRHRMRRLVVAILRHLPAQSEKPS
jgi:hypothetical protein